MAGATAKTTENDHTLETSAAASANENVRGINGKGIGSATNGIESISHESGDHRPLLYGDDPHCLDGILGTQETCLWALMSNVQDGGPGTDHFQPVPPIRIPCWLRRRSAADSAEEGVGVAAVAIGIRGGAGKGRISTMIGIVTREAVRKKADGAGNRKSGIGGTAGTQTRPGTFFGTTATLGTISAKLSARNPIEYYRTNLRQQKMSHPHRSPPRRPLSAPSPAASRQPRKFSHSLGNLLRPGPGR